MIFLTKILRKLLQSLGCILYFLLTILCVSCYLFFVCFIFGEHFFFILTHILVGKLSSRLKRTSVCCCVVVLLGIILLLREEEEEVKKKKWW